MRSFAGEFNEESCKSDTEKECWGEKSEQNEQKESWELSLPGESVNSGRDYEGCPAVDGTIHKVFSRFRGGPNCQDPGAEFLLHNYMTCN